MSSEFATVPMRGAELKMALPVRYGETVLVALAEQVERLAAERDGLAAKLAGVEKVAEEMANYRHALEKYGESLPEQSSPATPSRYLCLRLRADIDRLLEALKPKELLEDERSEN